MRCPNCGAELPDGAKFCTSCGSQMGCGSGQTPAPVAPQVPSGDYQTPEATPVPSPWQTPGQATPTTAPTQAYQQGPVMDETCVSPASSDTAASREEGERRDDEEYRRAKRAYKEARKNAGKSYMPAIAVGVVTALLVAATSAGAAGYYVTQTAQPDADKVQELTDQLNEANDKIESLESQLAEAKGANAATTTAPATTASTAQAAASVDLSRPETFVGTWKGSLTATEWSMDTNCYGGDKNPAIIKINSVNASTGQVSLDASLTYHGHDAQGVSGSSDTIDGDDYETYTGITGTLDGDTLKFDVPVAASGGDTKSMSVEAKFARSGGEVKMTAEVRSSYQRSGYLTASMVHDTFELTYQGSN